MVWFGTVMSGRVWCGKVRYQETSYFLGILNAVRYGQVMCGIVWYGEVRYRQQVSHRVKPCDILIGVRYGLVRSGLVW